MDELSEAWKSDPYWVSWGTKLDDTNLVYFLPEVYQTLVLLSDKKFLLCTSILWGYVSLPGWDLS